MNKPATQAQLDLLHELIQECYDGKAWHGPTLKAAVRRVSPAQAVWRPGRGRRCIAEIVVHAAYWKYAARRRLRGDKRGSFPLKGSNWFALPVRLSADQWRQYLRLLDDEHRQLCAAAESLPPGHLTFVPPGSRVNQGKLLRGIACHDVYHAGQVQTLKRLCPLK